MMLAYFRCFGEMASYHPRYSIVIGRYFPIFWNGSTDFVAVDLNDSGGNRVVLIEHETENLIRVIYPTFKAFLVDAIRSNETNEILACFQTGPSN